MIPSAGFAAPGHQRASVGQEDVRHAQIRWSASQTLSSALEPIRAPPMRCA
jgi:hypothetical protein